MYWGEAAASGERLEMTGENTAAARLWKVGVRRGMAYVEGKAVAERVLSATGEAASLDALAPSGVRGGRRPPEQFLPGTMAVYLDHRGRPFAWQIGFDMRNWEAVASAAGIALVVGGER